MLPGAWRPFWPPRHTPRISWRIKVTPMCSRGRCCAMNETAATKCRVFAFSKRTCAAKTVSMSLYCLKYGAWIQVCTGHGRSLLSSEQQFSKRVIIKAELRPKAGSSIFLSITVTPVCSIIKFLIKIIATTFIFTEWLEKGLLRIFQRRGQLDENSIGTLPEPNTFSRNFSYSSEKNGHNIASIF